MLYYAYNNCAQAGSPGAEFQIEYVNFHRHPRCPSEGSAG